MDQMTKEAADALLASAVIEVSGPDGTAWRVGVDGSISGFPPGSRVLNAAAPAFFALLGKAHHDDPAINVKQYLEQSNRELARRAIERLNPGVSDET